VRGYRVAQPRPDSAIAGEIIKIRIEAVLRFQQRRKPDIMAAKSQKFPYSNQLVSSKL
jgi:hypothetical protein